MSVKRICEVIMRDEKSILPVSHMIHGVYDIDIMFMPAINLSGEENMNQYLKREQLNINFIGIGKAGMSLKENHWDYVKPVTEKIKSRAGAGSRFCLLRW